jgi:hypothetical protein
VYSERGNIRRLHNPPDGGEWCQLLAAAFEFIAEEFADNGVSTKPAAIRLTRTGASSSARLAMRAGSATVTVDAIPRPMPGGGRRYRP